MPRIRTDIARRLVQLAAVVGCLQILPAAAGTGTGVPDMLVRLDAENGPAHLLVVDKSAQKLRVYVRDGQQGPRQVAVMACSTGKVAGDKRVSGDMKTPAGVYFIVRKFPDRDLSPRYGIAAYPLDYPHLLDRRAGLNGHSIWLHGTNRPLKPRDSNGCIALANADLARLDPYIRIRRTALLITDRVRSVPAGEARTTARDLTALVESWRAALEAGSYQAFLRLYARDYLPPIVWWREWHRLREEMAALDARLAVAVHRLDIYRQNDVFVVRFDLAAAAEERSVAVGSRKLFVQQRKDGLRIIGDEYLSATDVPDDGGDRPLVVAARDLHADMARKREIPALVDRWLAAWSAKDIDGYADCYAADFSADGMDLDAWLARKTYLNRKYRYIRVRRGELDVAYDDPLPMVTFRQYYASDAYRAEGIKTLRLKRERGRWKIYREDFRRR